MVPARPEDISELAAQGFREIDEFECRAVTGTSAAEQCFASLKNPTAETFTVMADGTPVAMFGAAPLVGMGIEPGLCVLWFLATDRLFEVRYDLMRQIGVWLDWLQRFSPTGINFVSVDNHIALAWCKAVGFEIGEPTPHGINGEMFRPVIRRL